ncbi:MAG: DNA mismatch endonuclease Vsr [Phycisphaerae bacterium]|nr:DNA mismatch endonuclease Vsr [Phycisphaerae bacterium]
MGRENQSSAGARHRLPSVEPARSRNMAAIRSRNTRPELLVRSVVHRLGYRFRLHHRDLPGTPDLVLPRYRAAIFVHGCFWHAHSCRSGSRCPRTNTAYWTAKRHRNRARDRRACLALRKDGWRVLTVWECETKDLVRLASRLRSFLERLSPIRS